MTQLLNQVGGREHPKTTLTPLQTVKETVSEDGLTINVPVVFMAQYIMVLRSATALRGALEGVVAEN